MTFELVSASQLSTLSQQEFVDTLEGIFEHSSWVAERAWQYRPFVSRSTLLDRLVQVMNAADRCEQKALIQAHPELAGKAAQAGTLTTESAEEQDSAGLANCSPDELETLTWLNRAYNAKFGHPFIMAVKHRDRAQIISAFTARLQNAPEEEFAECLRQIARIAEIRLAKKVAP